MSMNEKWINEQNRRDFLKGTSFAAMMTLMGGIPIRAEEKKNPEETGYKATEDPLKFGVIGCGIWGREILKTLATRPNAPVVAVCETYKPFLTRAKDAAPNAEPYTDYQKLLESKDVQAVVVATPSHQHKEIVLAALQAGKHVYCEAPMATTLDDARAIAQAARAAAKVNFQAGLQNRSDTQLTHLFDFLRTGIMGKVLKARSQSHKKQSWRRTSPNPDREKETNWRLDKALSLGLLGEIGIHQMDLGCWYLMGRPVAVTGFGGLLHWTDDGREIPDTVQAVFEFPNGVTFSQEITIANSFDADYDMFYGSDSAIMMRDRKAWMFKESDAGLSGWEVYARKETFYKDSGIVLGADATKLGPPKSGEPKPAETKPGEASPVVTTPPPQADTALSLSLQNFLTNSLLTGTAVEDFTASFGGTDLKALREYLVGLAKSRKPAAGWKEGYESAVIALKTNEAILKKQRTVFAKEWFEIG